MMLPAILRGKHCEVPFRQLFAHGLHQGTPYKQRGGAAQILLRMGIGAAFYGYRGDTPDLWQYAAAKGGMIAMHNTTARQYAAHDVISDAISPGFPDTAFAGD